MTLAPGNRIPQHDHSDRNSGGLVHSGTIVAAVGGATSPSSSAATGTAGGDLSGAYPSPTVAKINGSPLGTISAPATGDRLRWDGSTWVNSALIWRPVMVLDPTSGNYLPVTSGGDAVMTEA